MPASKDQQDRLTMGFTAATIAVLGSPVVGLFAGWAWRAFRWAAGLA